MASRRTTPLSASRASAVKSFKARAEFLDRRTLKAGEITVRARRFVIATGSRPSIPRFPGLDGVPFFTNETIFENDVLPAHLIVIGAGPIGCEMAQAHRRLGSAVTLIDAAQMLAKEDPAAVDVVRGQIAEEGIATIEEATIARIEKSGDGVAVVLVHAGRESTIQGSHLLIATGRQVNIEELGLDRAGVEATPKGITVDARLRSSNKRVFAAGDVVGDHQFTHVASYHAGIVLRNALFRLPPRTRPKRSRG